MNSLQASNHANRDQRSSSSDQSRKKKRRGARARAVICAAPRANVKLTTVMLIGGILVYIRIPSVCVPISRLVAD